MPRLPNSPCISWLPLPNRRQKPFPSAPEPLWRLRRSAVRLFGGRRVSQTRWGEIPASALQAHMQKAEQARAAILPIIAKLQASGALSLREIAAGLNAREIPTPRGAGEWSAVQVQRVLNPPSLLAK